jgi:hypothetical protein
VREQFERERVLKKRLSNLGRVVECKIAEKWL